MTLHWVFQLKASKIFKLGSGLRTVRLDGPDPLLQVCFNLPSPGQRSACAIWAGQVDFDPGSNQRNQTWICLAIDLTE